MSRFARTRHPKIRKPEARTPQPNPTFSKRLFNTVKGGTKSRLSDRCIVDEIRASNILIGKMMPPMLDPLTTIPVARARLFRKKCDTAPMAGKKTSAAGLCMSGQCTTDIGLMR